MHVQSFFYGHLHIKCIYCSVVELVNALIAWQMEKDTQVHSCVICKHDLFLSLLVCLPLSFFFFFFLWLYLQSFYILEPYNGVEDNKSFINLHHCKFNKGCYWIIFVFCFSYDGIKFQRAENIKKSDTVCNLLSLPLLVKSINSKEIMLYRLKDGCSIIWTLKCYS